MRDRNDDKCSHENELLQYALVATIPLTPHPPGANSRRESALARELNRARKAYDDALSTTSQLKGEYLRSCGQNDVGNALALLTEC